MITDNGRGAAFLAVPSVSRARRQRNLSSLNFFRCMCAPVPGFMDLASGRVQVQDVQEVDIAGFARSRCGGAA